MRAELLITPGCPHAARAEDDLRAVLAERGLPSEVEKVFINDLDHAAGLGFRGSPTIRLDGRDVVPSEPGGQANLGCRLYVQPDGRLAGGLPAQAIRAAFEARQAEAEAAAAARRARPRLAELPARLSRNFFLWASRRRWLAAVATGFPLTRPMVRRFIAGENLDDALDVLERLRERGLRWTLDVLGESVSSRDMATASADRYLEALDALAERGLEANVSLKLTQMGLDIDQRFCRDNVGRVVARAAEIGAFVRIDMEDHTRADATLSIARDLHADYHDVGVVIQSYLRRSADDVERLIREQIRVRLCKGAYDEPASVAYVQRAEVDESFVRLMERLMTDGRYPALATHDDQLIARAIEFADRNAIAPERFEFQMLHGVRRDLQDWLVEHGWTVRLYVPYGAEWYPYFMRRLGERPANVLFMVRSVWREGRGG
ncbi:MAG TPA: proline dehydrogenase family protein [Candidatus Limnocylindrales bacterium]|nr:proline dehydrogenase family protein [Candidatus Limnocylindrales bacterium]